jgi:hypothetical protein
MIAGSISPPLDTQSKILFAVSPEQRSIAVAMICAL